MIEPIKGQVVITWSGRDAAFVAKVPELPGCMAHGNSYDDALANIEEAMVLWLETAREDGIAIPEPLQFVAAG